MSILRNCLFVLLSNVSSTAYGFEYGVHDGARGWLEDHNHFRCMHGAKPLKWDKYLARKAEKLAEKHYIRNKGLKHDDPYNTWPYSGENLASGRGDKTCNGIHFGKMNQHCAVWFWYRQYEDHWRCSTRDWSKVKKIGNLTAMLWKGIDTIGCAGRGKYYVCEYGSRHCMSRKRHGGKGCSRAMPPHLPNFNKKKCPKDGTCVSCKVKSAAQCGGKRSAPKLPRAVPSTTTKDAPRFPRTTRRPDTTRRPGPVKLRRGRWCPKRIRDKEHAYCERKTKGKNPVCDFRYGRCYGSRRKCGKKCLKFHYGGLLARCKLSSILRAHARCRAAKEGGRCRFSTGRCSNSKTSCGEECTFFEPAV